ncbi:DUF3793 family protein [Alkaliphilus crotonatoxidans]
MNLNHCYCLNNKNDDFLKWYVELLGPVLLGVKPAEILSFPQHNQRNMEIVEGVMALFSQSRQIQFINIHHHERCQKILFYNSSALIQTLTHKQNHKFLMELGYPQVFTLESYIAFLLQKMDGGRVPDEIGLFLGYPLKDVIGFMGHPALKLTKVDGWRFYGDTRASDVKRQQILQARESIKGLLLRKSPQDIILSA